MEKVTYKRIVEDQQRYEESGTGGDPDTANLIQISLYEDFIRQLADGTLLMTQAKNMAKDIVEQFHIGKYEK